MASILAGALSVPYGARAETVIVKSRGALDLKPFKCETVYQSSVVKRLCYDAKEEYGDRPARLGVRVRVRG